MHFLVSFKIKVWTLKSAKYGTFNAFLFFFFYLPACLFSCSVSCTWFHPFYQVTDCMVLLLNQSINCNFFFFACVPSQIFSNMPDSSAPPVPPPRITPRKRQPITISKRPPRVFQALSHDHFQHTESNYQPPLVWLSSSSSSLSHPVSAECFFFFWIFPNTPAGSFLNIFWSAEKCDLLYVWVFIKYHCKQLLLLLPKHGVILCVCLRNVKSEIFSLSSSIVNTFIQVQIKLNLHFFHLTLVFFPPLPMLLATSCNFLSV